MHFLESLQTIGNRYVQTFYKDSIDHKFYEDL